MLRPEGREMRETEHRWSEYLETQMLVAQAERAAQILGEEIAFITDNKERA